MMMRGGYSGRVAGGRAVLRSLEWPGGALCDAGPVVARVAALALPGYMPEQLAGCQSVSRQW